MSWEIKQFKDVVQFPPKITFEKGESYSFIPMEDLSSGIKYVSPKIEKVWSGSGGAKFEEGDTLFARITPCLQNGKISQAKNLKNGKGFGSTEYFIFRGKENVSDSDFIYYFSLNEEFKKYAIGSMVGASGRQRADQKFVGEFEINLPPLETQKRIASILSNYDDWIENNLKRIKLLEEIAQSIYKEWFVNFRFPNYEHTEFDMESGLPFGWRKGKVADLCEVKSGYAFKSKDWQTEGNPVMKIKNITNNTVDITDCDYVDDEVAQNAEKFELFEGDVLIAMTGATVGKVGLIPKIDKRIYINQRVGLFRPFSEIENNVYLVFSFFMTDEAQKQILNFAGGAAQPNISSSQISEVELNIGSDEVLKMFESKIQSIMVQIQTLYSQNQKLKEARDILLPRLMNRTIEV